MRLLLLAIGHNEAGVPAHFMSQLLTIPADRICVNYFHHCDVTAWAEVDLFQPRLEVYVCITYFINDENEVLAGLLPFALDKLQDFADLIGFGGGSLNDLNILLTEEATGQQVVQDALSAPQPGHQQLSVAGEDVGAAAVFYLIHVYCRSVSSVGQAQDKPPQCDLVGVKLGDASAAMTPSET